MSTPVPLPVRKAVPASPIAAAPTAHDGVRPHSRGLEIDLPAHSYVTASLGLR